MAAQVPVIYYNQKAEDSPVEARWWAQDEKEMYRHVFAVIKNIQENQDYRRIDNLRHARLYANTDLNAYIVGAAGQQFGRKISLNVVRSCCNTATAKIAKSKPRPLFLTSNGDHSQQKRAKGLTKYVDGIFYREKVYPKGKKAFLDSCIFGTGCVKVFKQHDKVQFERVFIDEILVDDVDGRDQSPRQLHQIKIVSREVLLDLFPKHADKIRACNAYKIRNQARSGSPDMVQVTESWHLRSGSDVTDGCHLIAIENCTLQKKQYDKEYFPFVFLYWDTPILGFYGEGLAAQCTGIQLEINLIMQRIKEAQEQVAVPRVYVEEGSGVNTSHLTDEIGGIVKYRGTAPIFSTPIAMNREMYDYLEYLYRKAFEDTGISQLSATSKKPAGLESAVALREYQDIETERFALVGERWQEFYLELSRIAIDIQRDIEKENPGQSVNVIERNFVQKIKWKDVDLENDSFVMQAFPTNFLPKTPEGKLAYTQELIQGGYLDDPREALALLDFPDLEGFFNLRTAAIDDVKFVIDKMVEDGEYTPPEPYMDLNLAIKLTQATYLRAKTTGLVEARLELLRRYMDECQEMLLATTPVAKGPALPPAPSGAPGVGVPPAPPTSDLMPIA